MERVEAVKNCEVFRDLTDEVMKLAYIDGSFDHVVCEPLLWHHKNSEFDVIVKAYKLVTSIYDRTFLHKSEYRVSLNNIVKDNEKYTASIVMESYRIVDTLREMIESAIERYRLKKVSVYS